DWSERIAMVLLPPLLIYLFLPGLRRLYWKLSGTGPVRKKPVRRRPHLPEPGETTPHQPTHHS
ncbi:MAG: hypothetical protein K2Q10_13985, partial [Rhodospirillales bacterium]|nr:hypothetical protein [Rhodospirillales bacterium]